MEILVGSTGTAKVPVFVYPGFPNYFSCPRGLKSGQGYVNVRKQDLRHLIPTLTSSPTEYHHRLRLSSSGPPGAPVVETTLKRVFALSCSLLPICDGDPSGPDTLYRVHLVDFRYFLCGGPTRSLLGHDSTEADNVFNTTEYQEMLHLPYWEDGDVSKYTETTWIGEWSDTWFEDVFRKTVLNEATIFNGTTDFSFPPAEGDLPGIPTTSPTNITLRSISDIQNLFLMLGIDLRYNPLTDHVDLVRTHHPDDDDDLTDYLEDYDYLLANRQTPTLHTYLTKPNILHVRFPSFYEKRTKYERISPFHTITVDLEAADYTPDDHFVTVYDYSLAEFSGDDIDGTVIPDNLVSLVARADEIGAQYLGNIFSTQVYSFHRFLPCVPGPCITEVVWKEAEVGPDRSLVCGTSLTVAPPQLSRTRPFPPAKLPGELTQADINDISSGSYCECYEECAEPDDLIITIENTPETLTTDQGGEVRASYRYRIDVALQGDPLWSFASGEHVLTLNSALTDPSTGLYYWDSTKFQGPCPDVPASEPDTNYFWRLALVCDGNVYGTLDPQQVQLALLYDSDDNPETSDDCFSDPRWTELRFWNINWFDPGCGNLFELNPLYMLRSQVYTYGGPIQCKVCVEPTIATHLLTGSSDWCAGDPNAVDDLEASLTYGIHGWGETAAAECCCELPYSLLFPEGSTEQSLWDFVPTEWEESDGACTPPGMDSGVIVARLPGGLGEDTGELDCFLQCSVSGTICLGYDCDHDEVDYENYRFMVTMGYSVDSGGSVAARYLSDWMTYDAAQTALLGGFTVTLDDVTSFVPATCFDAEEDVPTTLTVNPF